MRSFLAKPLPIPLRILIMTAGVAALLIALGFGLLSLANGLELRTFEQHLSDSSTNDLNTHMVAQSFRSDRPNLDRIDLQVSSFVTLPQSGRFSLLKGDGPDAVPVYQASLDTASFADNPFLEFRFPAVPDSAGVIYTMVLTTSDAPLNTAVGLLYSSYDTISSGKMYTDQGAGRGDLIIATYYRYSPAGALNDVAGTLTAGLPGVLSWTLLLLLPGLAVLVWLPTTLTTGQRLLAAPGVSLLTLNVFFLLMRAVSLPVGSTGMWLVMAICAGLLVGAVVGGRLALRLPRADGAGAAYWTLLTLVLVITLYARMLPLRDAQGGLGLDAYHHTLIAQMFVDHGGVPFNYEPFAPLDSFTYHYGFHAMTASAAWLTGQTSPVDMLELMPQSGQIGTTLPVLTLALFSWKVFGNRWAGLLAGAFAGLFAIFPAYYVNWSRYTQGLGLALLPVAMLLFLQVVERPARPQRPGGDPAQPAAVTWQTAIRQSSPYMLGVIGAAGLFLTHYRIAIVFAAFVALYVVARLVADLRSRVTYREVVAPTRRTLLMTVLTVAALSPWLLNLLQNFRSHLVGRDTASLRDYYDLSPISGLLTHWSLLAMFAVGLVGLIFALRAGRWVALLSVLVWVPVALWSNPYILSGVLSGVRLPYAGYLDVTTVAQSAWLPLALTAGYGVARIAEAFLSPRDILPASRLRLWQAPVLILMALVLLLTGMAAADQIATNLDRKPYITSADVQALIWMRDNLPRNSNVLANPFAFPWAPNIVYGSDAGMWVPLVAGVAASVPPLPTYNERLADPNYINKILDVVKYEPFGCREADPHKCAEPGWQGLKDAGITHIFVGSRGGALDVPTLLASTHTKLIFHVDAVWVFALE